MSLGLKKRVSRTIPFGYKVNEEDDKLLEPIQEELEAIEQAKQYIKVVPIEKLLVGCKEKQAGIYLLQV